METYRFEKKFVNRDVDCCSGGFFWPSIGVDGAEPRRHAFSYDVSANGKKQKISISFNVTTQSKHLQFDGREVISHRSLSFYKFNIFNRNVIILCFHVSSVFSISTIWLIISTCQKTITTVH